MSDTVIVNVGGAEYKLNTEKEYEKDGHIYCKTCHERIDGTVIKFLNKSVVYRKGCRCFREREAAAEKRKRELEKRRLKENCFISRNEWEYTFENYKGEQNKGISIAKNYVEHFEKMKSDNIGLLFYGNVGSGKTYIACSIANAVIDKYMISVKVRNFSQIINELQKSSFDIDKNRYIENITNTPLLILDDLGIERDTSYAKEQVYNIINSRYIKKKPTIITTNLPLNEILNTSMGLEYKRIYSRVTEMTIPVMITGEDYRRKIHKNKLDLNRNLLISGGDSD